MSKVKITGNASGTGTFTISAPNSNTDRNLTLPDGAGEILTDASSLPAANLTGTLPAIDGSALTGISGGKVLQVVQGTTSTASSTSSTSYVDSGLSASITPSSTSSKIVVIVSQSYQVFVNGSPCDIWGYKLLRDSTDIYDAYPNSDGGLNISGYGIVWGMSINYLDSPSTTSSVTYKTQHKARFSHSGALITAQYGGATSSMILMEIGA